MLLFPRARNIARSMIFNNERDVPSLHLYLSEAGIPITWSRRATKDAMIHE